jgi:hypothetical protein
MASIGFVVISHNQPAQMLRLVRRLTAMFGDVPIVCHHDFGQAGFTAPPVPDNVRFVRPHLTTRWGDTSIVEAAMCALKLLYKKNAPRWFSILSGADYPIKPAARILEDLERSSFDAFIDNRLILHESLPLRVESPSTAAGDFPCDSELWKQQAYDRYIALRLPCPLRQHPIRKPFGGDIHVRHPAIIRPFRFFSDDFRCYAGEFWFTANDKAADRLLADSANRTRLLRHYRARPIADESFFHCLLCNDRNLRVSKSNYRYIDWSRGGRHPKNLAEPDMPAMLASTAHFARKFAPESPVLDVFDELTETCAHA